MRFQTTMHSSWLITFAAVGFLGGVTICAWPAWAIFDAVWWCVFALVLLVVVFWWRFRWMAVVILIAGLLLGLWRGSVEQVALAGYQPFIGQKLLLSGTVAEDVEKGNSGELHLKVHDVRVATARLPGEVWVSASSHLVIGRSDHVVLEGKLRPGFGNFPASMSFAKVVKVERPDQADIARDVRDGFADNIRKAIPEPAASLGNGFLTGQQSSLPPDLDEQLKVVGLTHIVVASGANLTILVRFARRALARTSKFMSTISAAFLVIGFVLVTGFSPSMSRASIVTGLSLATWYYGRAMHPLVILPLVAAATVAVNPLFLWGDIGWYLSFSAFGGVMIVAPLVHDYFWGKKKAGIVRQILVDTSCAQIVTMPIIAFSFGTYAPYGLLANILVLPLIPITMALTFVAGLAGSFLAGIAQIVGWPAQFVLNYMINSTRVIAELPGAQGEIVVGVGIFVGGYIVIIIVSLWMWRRTLHNFRGDSLVE